MSLNCAEFLGGGYLAERWNWGVVYRTQIESHYQVLSFQRQRGSEPGGGKTIDSRKYNKCWSKVTACLKSSLDHQKYEDGPPRELLSEETLDFIANELMPAFKAILEDEELREVPLLNIDRKSHSFASSFQVAVLERWQVLVRLMGKHLHTRNATINAMMTVVERAFKLTDQLILAAAFKAWQHLMDCFALDPKILTNPKRINLLVRPFTIKNVKTESGYRSKLESWWHLIHLLGEDISQFGPTVVVPFLSFCFITKAGTGGRKEVGSTPQSPAKRHSMLSKLCLEALVQVGIVIVNARLESA